MSASRYTCVFASKGRAVSHALRQARDLDPGARICAVLPPSTRADEAEPLADEVLALEARAALTNPGACLRLIRQLRAKRFDRFLILFPSPRLQTLAALSGAKECLWLNPRGKPIAVPRSLAMVLLRTLAATIFGRLLYAALWATIRLLPVRKD